MSCVSLLYFCKKAENKYGGDPSTCKHTSTTPLHDSGTHSAHLPYTYTHILDYAEYCFRDDKIKKNVSNHD
jgi:hypothetical protein